MRRPWRALRSTARLLGVGAALAAATTPVAQGAEETDARLHSLAEVPLGNSQEGPKCPSTGKLELVHTLEASETDVNAHFLRVKAEAAKQHGGDEGGEAPGGVNNTGANAGVVIKGDAQTGESKDRFAEEEPLEVALAELMSMNPGTKTPFLPPRAYPSGLHRLEILPGPGLSPRTFGTMDKRPYLLYVPEGYQPKEPIPLWIHAPGTDVAMDTVLAHNAFLADRCTVAMVVLSGLWRKMSVALHAQASHDPFPDDVAYTRAVLREVTQRVHVDPRRVRCVGFSRGGRFCSRLASELAGFISAIAAVSGIRYPEPNNATRPVPVLAIHGVKDEVNRFEGGLPPYWGESVMDSIRKWGTFNGCKRLLNIKPREDIEVIKYTECKLGADVTLIKLLKMGHRWPSMRTLNARVGILQFFSEHPGPESSEVCHTVNEGEAHFRQCDEYIGWAMRAGIFQQPDLYGGLTSASSRHDFQLVAHRQVYADCPAPCQDVPSTGALWASEEPSSTPLPQRAGSAVAVMVPLAVMAAVGALLSGRLPIALPSSVPVGYRCMGGAFAKLAPEKAEIVESPYEVESPRPSTLSPG